MLNPFGIFMFIVKIQLRYYPGHKKDKHTTIKDNERLERQAKLNMYSKARKQDTSDGREELLGSHRLQVFLEIRCQ